MSEQAGGAAPTASNWNLPNALTVVRIVMVPFFAVALIAGGVYGADSLGARWAALALFVAAMITDWADGHLARSRQLITSFGKIADPIADKLLTGAAFITLSWLGELWWWVTAVILVREWGITVMRLFVIKYGVMAASKGGKVKTVLQTVALVVMLVPLGLWGTAWLIPGWALMAAVTAITVWTGLVYVRDAREHGLLRHQGCSQQNIGRERCMMGEGIRMVGPTEAEEAARSLHDALAGTGRTVATAESLTGGDVGGAICTIAGASEYYLGGVISYASAVKAAVLGVDRGLLERCGSVDAEVAVQMAAGTARVCGADYGVSTTGVAGPEPHDGKPVGTVFIGVFGPAGSAAHERHYTGDRAQIRAQATYDAILLLQAVASA